MKVILKFFVFGILMTIISGCSGKSLPIVEQEELDKYEKSYMAEYQTIKQKNANYQPSFKWIQPKNKKEECKVWVGYNPQNDRTIKSDYNFYWDGDCKDGYADGLGSAFEATQFADRQQISIYMKGNPDTYCVNLDPLNGITKEGECLYYTDRPSHYVKTTVDERNNDLIIKYEIGADMSTNSPMTGIVTWPFSDNIVHYKTYPNFSYEIYDGSKNEFTNVNYLLLIKNSAGARNGFLFTTYKNGIREGEEYQNDILIREVQLPKSYFDKANSVLSEIRNEVNIALDAQKKARIIKEKYKNKICKDSVKVDFMDNNEYKAICKEDEKNAQLKVKIDAKLAQIEQQKQAKRQQQNQQRMIQAQEDQAFAAQMSASAQQQANFNQSLQNVNNSLNNSYQQQQNMYNNTMNIINSNQPQKDIYQVTPIAPNLYRVK